MTIPDFQKTMLPFLQVLADKREHSLSECVEKLAKQFKLTDEELTVRIPSGYHTVFYDRVSWARTHLNKAGLLQIVRRGYYTITDSGLAFLKTSPKEIRMKMLFQFDGYSDFVKKISKKNKPEETQIPAAGEATPREIFEQAYSEMKNALAYDLLEKIKSAPPEFDNVQYLSHIY